MIFRRLVWTLVVSLGAVACMVGTAAAATFTVVTTSDSGGGSLREAIESSNSSGGPDQIHFNIPGIGVRTITLLTPLPLILGPVTIDGYTQPGALPNTLPDGNNAVLLIEIDGNGVDGYGFDVRQTPTTIRGLVINNFGLAGIALSAGSQNTVAGCFIGTDPTGTARAPNDEGGIQIFLSNDNVIGGTAPSDRNLISGHPLAAVHVFTGASGNQVLGNFIGTNASGTTLIESGGTLGSGIRLAGSSSNVIGGTAAGARNVIAGHLTDINVEFAFLTPSDGTVIQGNHIGVDVTGSTGLGRVGIDVGIFITSSQGTVIGGITTSARNVIASQDYGVWGFEAHSTVVHGNLIGTNSAGTAPLPPTDVSGLGVRFDESSNVLVGGGTTGAGNVIAGLGTGVNFQGAGSYLLAGNWIGTNPAGAAGLGNGFGVTFGGSSGPPTNVTIGGTVPGFRNVISGNDLGGVFASTGSGILIQGNFIGTDPSGTAPLGNGFDGVSVSGPVGVVVGGVSAGAGNTIAFNARNGILVTGASSGVSIQRNSIHSNGSLGIDLFPLTVTPNDPGDADSGANGIQNFPILRVATPIPGPAGGTNIQGFLQSAPNTTYTLDFYSSDSCFARPQEFLEGRTWIGSAVVATDGQGEAPFDVDVPGAIETGQPVSATATDPGGSTSEFSQRIVLDVLPPSGSPAGGTGVTISGLFFEPGAEVTVGGTPASTTFVDSNTLTATMPPRAPGTLNDVTVTNPSGIAGTLLNGWIADFTDVPGAHAFYAFVTRLTANGITAGIGGGLYGVDEPITRAQMAVFLLRGRYGLCFFPPPATGTVFGDVGAGSFAAAWIEELADQVVTAGCGGGNYCPDSPVTRAQMGVFLLRMLNGPSYVPPPCTTPTFADVPCSNPFAPWIEELVDRGITAGCGGGNYCPGDVNTRGQMSVFISTTFNLP